jgi:hypothetical protein
VTGLLTGRRAASRRTLRPGRGRGGASGGGGRPAGGVLTPGCPAAQVLADRDLDRGRDGIASSAPSTPNSVLPNSTETSTTNGCTCTARAWMRGWMNRVLDLLVDDRPDDPDDRVGGKSLEDGDDADDDRAERAPIIGTRSSRKTDDASGRA